MNALQFEIEVIACPLCGTRDHERPFLDEDLGTRFVRCERCGSVYLNPRPGAVSRDAYYLQTEKHIQSQLRIAESRRPAFALISKAVRECKPGGSLLDVGCNTGGLFDYFDLREWRCFGIEPDANLAAYTGITHDATVHAGTIEEADFPTFYFDAVTMIDTLCLLPDPLADLRRIHSLLKPGGVLAIECAGQAYALGRSVGALNYMLEGRWSRLRTDGRHLYFFTPAGVAALLALSGFAVREWIAVPGPSLPGRLHHALCKIAARLSTRALNYCPKLLCIAGPA